MKWIGDFIKPSKNDSDISKNFYQLYNEIVMDDKERTRIWEMELIKSGVKAAHPDDGWVNRIKNEVHLCYPYFSNYKLNIGDKIALGSYEEYRIVTIESIRNSIVGDLIYYKFIC